MKPPSLRAFWMRAVIWFGPALIVPAGSAKAGGGPPRPPPAPRPPSGGVIELTVDPHFARVPHRPERQRRRAARGCCRHIDRACEPDDAIEIGQAARLPVAGYLHLFPVRRDVLRRRQTPIRLERAQPQRDRQRLERQRRLVGLVRSRERRLVAQRRDVERAAQPFVRVVVRSSGSRDRAPARCRPTPGISERSERDRQPRLQVRILQEICREHRFCGIGGLRQHHRGGLAHASRRVLQRGDGRRVRAAARRVDLAESLQRPQRVHRAAVDADRVDRRVLDERLQLRHDVLLAALDDADAAPSGATACCRSPAR